MRLNSKSRTQIDRVAKKLNLKFIRVFGSYLLSPRTARDIDIVFGDRDLSLGELSYLQSELSKIFKKEVDLVRLAPGVSGALIRAIASTSVSLWEKPKIGVSSYADMVCRLLAIAEDDRLSMTPDLVEYNKRIRRERLRVS